jgi:hypothetical protein
MVPEITLGDGDFDMVRTGGQPTRLADSRSSAAAVPGKPAVKARTGVSFRRAMQARMAEDHAAGQEHPIGRRALVHGDAVHQRRIEQLQARTRRFAT